MSWRRIQDYPVYPYLIAMLPVVHFHEVNFRILPFFDGWRIVLFYWFLVALMMETGRLIWGDRNRAALVVAPLAVVLFKGADIGPVWSLVVVGVSCLVGILFARKRPSVSRLAPALNLGLLALVVLPVFSAWNEDRAEARPRPSALFGRELGPSANNAGLPDIYFIMMDGLGQPDYVEKVFGAPRRRYSGVLERRGFQVLRRSFANYPQTALSTAATLNAAYVQDLLANVEPEAQDRRVLAELIGNNRVVRYLDDAGYRLCSFPSGYPLTEIKHGTHRFRPLVDPTFLEYYVLEDGVLPLIQPLLGRGPADFSFAMRRSRLRYTFEHLQDARQKTDPDRPIFVFAHILAPHPPFVFGPEGEALRSRKEFGFADGSHYYNIHGRGGTPYGDLYADQAVYVMEQLGMAVDRILEASDRPPVIIIQGDHGSGANLAWDHPGATNHLERFGIFNAWYVPPGLEIEIPEGRTSVQTFPSLFEAIFGLELDPGPDRLYFARMSHPFDFIDMGVEGAGSK